MTWMAEFNKATASVYMYSSADPVSVLVEIERKLQDGWALNALTSGNNHTNNHNSVIEKPSEHGFDTANIDKCLQSKNVQ